MILELESPLLQCGMTGKCKPRWVFNDCLGSCAKKTSEDVSYERVTYSASNLGHGRGEGLLQFISCVFDLPDLRCLFLASWIST